MRIDLESENQVLNGSSSSTCPILIVRVMLCLPVNLFLIQDILVGGTIERWEDPFLRKCFEKIFAIGEIMTHTLLKAAWMLEVLFMADRDSLASSEHSKDGSL